MEESEKAPLMKRTEFRPIETSPGDPEVAVVQCCCVESTRFARVPVIRTLFKKNTEKVGISASMLK